MCTYANVCILLKYVAHNIWLREKLVTLLFCDNSGSLWVHCVTNSRGHPHQKSSGLFHVVTVWYHCLSQGAWALLCSHKHITRTSWKCGQLEVASCPLTSSFFQYWGKEVYSQQMCGERPVCQALLWVLIKQNREQVQMTGAHPRPVGSKAREAGSKHCHFFKAP